MDMLMRGAGQFFRRLFADFALKVAISMQFPGRRQSLQLRRDQPSTLRRHA
jgi:hypothetical protein